MISVRPISFVRITGNQPSDHYVYGVKEFQGLPVKPAYGQGYYVTARGFFSIVRQYDGSWSACIETGMFEDCYPAVMDEFERSGFEQLTFKRRRDCLDALQGLLTAIEEEL